jgi:uncharacterized protein (DUF58 family)
MNDKSRILLILICGLISSALILRDGNVLLLALPLLTYLIVGLAQAPTRVVLAAARTVSKPAITAHEQVEQRITVKNLGDALGNLCLTDMPGVPDSTAAWHACHMLSLPAGGTTEFRYGLQPGRGVYSWTSIRACASDPLGLFEHTCEVPAPGGLLVRPAPVQVRPLTLRPQSTILAAGPIPARVPGPGTDYWGIREYQPGDSLRRLNWRLAARHPRQLFTNEYEREEIADFGLILDTRRLSSANAAEEALFEHSVSAAAALAEGYLKHGNRVSLLLFGTSMKSVFPGCGKHQLNQLIWNLARAKLGPYLPFDYLEYFPARLFPVRSLVVIFSTVDARDLDAYARLRAYGYDVLLISPDPVDFTSRLLPAAEVHNLAFRAARAERIIQLKRLLKMGVKVVDWQVDIPLDTVVHETARHYLPGRRI